MACSFSVHETDNVRANWLCDHSRSLNLHEFHVLVRTGSDPLNPLSISHTAAML